MPLKTKDIYAEKNNQASTIDIVLKAHLSWEPNAEIDDVLYLLYPCWTNKINITKWTKIIIIKLIVTLINSPEHANLNGEF